MAYRVELTARAARDLRRISRTIHAADALQARIWFNGHEAAIFSLDEYPSRGAVIPEDKRFRHLLYGNKPHIYQPLAAQSDRQSRVPGR